MKIISPFKDYYNWVAGKYGGGLTQRGHFVIGSEFD